MVFHYFPQDMKRQFYVKYTGRSKISVHLTITVHHQVHRDFLITLYDGFAI